MKTVQKFSEEYIEQCRSMTPDQIAKFLDEFRLLHHPREPKNPMKLISIKIPKGVLQTFRTKCELSGIPYQTMIKKLMVEWLR